MTPHAILVFVTALIFLVSALIGLQIGRLLGPAYDRSKTVPWGWRLAVWVGSAVLFFRAVTLLFPGKLIAVDRMSGVLTAEGVVFLALGLWLLDMVMEKRNPPPWSVQMVRVFALMGRGRGLVKAGLMTPAAGLLDRPPVADEDDADRPRRLVMLTAAFGLLTAVVALVVLSAAEAHAAF